MKTQQEIVIQKNEVHDIAVEIWATAQLLPDEGIEDGVRRIKEVLFEYIKERV